MDSLNHSFHKRLEAVVDHHLILHHHEEGSHQVTHALHNTNINFVLENMYNLPACIQPPDAPKHMLLRYSSACPGYAAAWSRECSYRTSPRPCLCDAGSDWMSPKGPEYVHCFDYISLFDELPRSKFLLQKKRVRDRWKQEPALTDPHRKEAALLQHSKFVSAIPSYPMC